MSDTSAKRFMIQGLRLRICKMDGCTCRSLLCVLLISILANDVSSVDKNNFKTCDQSGFCKRQKLYSPSLMPYELDLKSLVLTSDSAQFYFSNTLNKAEYLLRLIGYDNGVVRIFMNERNPIRPRYEVPKGDVVLEDQLNVVPLRLDYQDSGVVILELPNTDTTVKVITPFLIEVLSGQTSVFQINPRGLLKFEPIRVKPADTTEPAEEASDGEDGEDDEERSEAAESELGDKGEETTADQQSDTEEQKAAEEEEEHAVWEEKYKTHHDSKPNGATSIGVDMSFIGFEHVYGIPEHADSFALKSTVDKDPYRLYNLDVFEYELDNGMALYGSVPVMLAHNAMRTIGVFWNNPSEMWIDVSSSKADRSTLGKLVDFVTQDDSIPKMDTRWVAESGVFDLYVMLGPRPNDVYKQYASLTGTTSLPPMFSLAYQQSRWNYNDEADVKQIHDNFDLHDIPMDVVWLDIEHTDGKRYFTWDGSKFPDSLAMVANLTAKGRKLVTIVDPHIKRDDAYKIYKQIRDLDMFVKDRDGKEFDGWCWPGSSSYPDFTRADVRDFWASKFAYDDYSGTTADVFTWNDMNEPSVFNGPEITMHKDAKHAGDWEHRDVHNLYGFYVHQATADGQVRRSGGELRPFVLSRSFYAGSQRHGAVWTGDNMGEWGHLKVSLPMILSQAITGITFTGADIGGFFRNPNAELVTRWYQTAAFTPFFRAHSHLDTKRREPWLLPEENMKIIRDAIITRYALLPYWYTLFYINEKEGIPPTRPMWSEFPDDPNTFAEQEQFLLGSGIMVRPVLDEQASGISLYFPGGQHGVWYAASTLQSYPGGSKAYISVTLASQPYFYRGGYIIPRKDRVRRSSTQMADDPYTLVVALDNQYEANGELYIDDYKTFRYRKGQYIYREFKFSNNQLINTAKDKTSFTTASWLEAVKIIGLRAKPNSIYLQYKGAATPLSFTYDEKKSFVTIRKPACNIAEDWTISIL